MESDHSLHRTVDVQRHGVFDRFPALQLIVRRLVRRFLPLVVQNHLLDRRRPLLLALRSFPFEQHPQELLHQIRRRHRRQFGVRIERRRDFDNVEPNEVERREAAQDRFQFARRPAARFGRTRRGGHRRIDDVNVETQVCGARGLAS